jgi:hypothetical protein
VSGQGGVGPLPSSRLTRILQEKAEAIRRKRTTAEAAQKEADEKVAALEQLGILPAGASERQQQLRELTRRTDWDQLESQSRALLEFLGSTVPSTIETRRRRMEEELVRYTAIGVPIPPEVKGQIAELARPSAEADWADAIARLARVESTLAQSATEHVGASRARALEVARWAGLPPARLAEFERRLPDVEAAVREQRPAEAIEAIQREITTGLPEALERRRGVRDSAARLRATAEELGAPTRALDAALSEDQEAQVGRWPETTARVQEAVNDLGEVVRERGAQALESLRGSLDGLAEFGIDASAPRREVEAVLARLPKVPPVEIGPLLAAARGAAEEPIVAVVAGLLDEVRPRLAGARRLGRDPTEVFGAMNRAREALRLKIYSEALAASQEALDKVRRLTEDVDAVRDELAGLEEMIARFRESGFPATSYEATLAKIRTRIDRVEIEPARQALAEAVRGLGKEALAHFLERWTALDRVREFARARGFLPQDVDAGLAQARELLDRGELSGAAERIARVDVALRAAAAPFVARRVEEIEQGFRDIPDEELTAPVRRLLADADVTLRVRQDLPRAIESLRRAEREFSAVFAARASALVEGLETEVRVLESMGGAGDEIQRQIDEVQEIFNLGDFVKASRASQELKTRAQQQQLVRSEEAISHAKLALVELDTMGLDLAPLRGELDRAQAESRDGHFLEAYKIASPLEARASASRAAAQGALERFARTDEILARLRADGGDLSAFVAPLRDAREAFRSLEFDRALRAVAEVEERAGAEDARIASERQLEEIAVLLEEGARLAVPMEGYAARAEKLRTERATAPGEATRTGVALLHEELVALLKPHFDEHLRLVERELDLAKSVGVPVEPIVATVAEARRRIALPVPSGAAAMLDEARAALISTRGFVEQAEKVVRRVREALSQADVLRVDVATLRPKVDHLEKLLQEHDYARVVEAGGTLERELSQATFQHVSKIVAGFQASVTQLRRGGGDTSIAENLLQQARTALEQGNPVAALQFAAQSENEVERVDLQRRIAEGALAAVERAVARAKEEGVGGPQADDAVRAARESFERGDYPSVLELSIEVSETMAAGHEGLRRARSALAAARTALDEASALGAETSEASARLAEAGEELARGHYTPAMTLASEATERSRWSIDRMFAVPLGELRREVEAGRAHGLTSAVEPLDSTVTEAEAALRAGSWTRVRTSLARADAQSRKLFQEVVERQWKELGETTGPVTAEEKARRADLKGQLDHLRDRRDLGEALRVLAGELEQARSRRREEITKAMTEFRDRLWVGERLGLDTTPAMQTFSEARVALDAEKFGPALQLLDRARAGLEDTAKTFLTRRRKELQSEVTFAEEGLHVAVGPVKERLREADELAASGRVIEAGRLVLSAVEEINLRKSLHRELTNLHYLLDAALGRAGDLGVDTTEARKLLAESLALRETDYAAALEKAREALRLLRQRGVSVSEPAAQPPSGSGLWPFRRPPPT